MDILLIVIYTISLTFLLLFSLGQLNLTFYYRKNKTREEKKEIKETTESWPKVTVQLPIYNERYVVQRLIDSVAVFDYPSDCLEIQVLDDSDDETIDLIEERVNFWRAKGLDIQHLRRKERKGFKAGALEYGTDRARGEFLAIFDADFLPETSFLKETIPHFDEQTGMVQTRWGHVNEDYSWLTKLQAFGLNAHFTIEQTGRNKANSFISFNGTAGVWRKEAIINSGGWSFETLTEDLDLSYRAQMKGWKFKYLEDVVSPAELPVIIPAIKSQQYRWNKGAAETARKNLLLVLKSKLGITSKLHATFHLLNSSVFFFLLIAALLSIPMLYFKSISPGFNLLYNLGSVFLLGFVSIGYFYWESTKKVKEVKTRSYYLKKFPSFLTFSMGLSFHNSLAFIEGLLGFKTPFIRTPKFNITNKNDSWKGNKYISNRITPMTLIEGLLSIYFIFGIVLGFQVQDYGLMIFHAMMAIGFGGVFLYSLLPFYAYK